MCVVRPIVRWAGSKKRLVPTLRKLVPKPFNVYYEPFFGSGCLFTQILPERSVIGDFNSELIGSYRTLRRYKKEVVDSIESIPNDSETYYELRGQDVKTLNSVQRAVRFFYLNRFCFNGIYRTNRWGRFNVPRGTKTGDLPTRQDYYHFARSIKSSQLIANDFQVTVHGATKGDFVYLDPPYTKNSKLSYGEYGYGAFNGEDLPRLLDLMRDLDSRGCKVLLSYAMTEHFEFLRKYGWNIHPLSVRRSIAGFENARVTVEEILVSNYSSN